MSNQEMIDNIEKICGRDSISFYNIRNYANADNIAVKCMYKRMLEREKWEIENKLDELYELRKKLDLIEKLERQTAF